ncbi:MAG TPA: hypothetical protein VIU87_12245, partial [Mycobacterium sp.]
DTYNSLTRRTENLIARVYDEFDLEASEPLTTPSNTPPDLTAVHLPPSTTLRSPGGRFGTIMLTARSTLVVPTALFGIAGSLLGLSTAITAPAAVVVTTTIGQQVIRDEKQRQLVYRRQVAKREVTLYLNDAEFILRKEVGDALRRTTRFLREAFERHATTMLQLPATSLTEVQRAQQLTGHQHSIRIAEVRAESGELRALKRYLGELLHADNDSTPESGFG